jgi:phage protein D
MPRQQFLPQFFVKIGGNEVPEDFMDAIVEIVVDASLILPSMFSICLFDEELKWVDDNLLDIGKAVEIKASMPAEIGTQEGILIKGEITALEPHFSVDGRSTLVVRGYDKSHRLHLGAKTRTFLKMTDSDIVQKIAGEVGLSAQVDATTDQYDFIMQYNQTNYEFLKSRADRIGYKFSAAEGNLYFKKGETTLGSGPTLEYGETLKSFEPRLTAVHQADKMKVTGWDGKMKKAIVGQKTPLSALNQGGIGKTGGAAASSAFSSAEAIIVDCPVDDQQQAVSLANGLSTDISLDFLQAEGVSFGAPNIKPGYTVTIQGVGTRFSGKYFVTSATHIYNANGYDTHFSISGRDPNTLQSLVAHSDGNSQQSGRVNGLVIGLVTNLNDPDNLGRVKVKYPWLGTDIESDWVRIAAPMAGKERGLMILPEVDDEVLVAFEHGDIHHPYIVGSLWNNTDKPPVGNSVAVGSGKVNQRVFKTRVGHEVIFNDTDGQEQISIKSKSGHNIILNDKGGSENITIKDKTGSNSMVIDSAKNSMAIKVGGDFSVEATGKITMKSTGAMSLEATGNATMKGMNATVEGTTKSEMKGMQVSVSGTTTAELKGSAMVTVQGGLVKIN